MWNRFANWVSNGPPIDPVSSEPNSKSSTGASLKHTLQNFRGDDIFSQETILTKESEKRKKEFVVRKRSATKKFVTALRSAFEQHKVLNYTAQNIHANSLYRFGNCITNLISIYTTTYTLTRMCSYRFYQLGPATRPREI